MSTPEFNGTTDGADEGYSSGVEDLNIFYEPGHMAFILVCAVLVLLMIPGVGFFYSGLARRKSALELLLLCLLAIGVASFQWYFWGYSLAFSKNGGPFIGTLSNFGLMDTLAQPGGSDYLPEILFVMYQGMFASITPALAIGAVADRGRILPALVFIFIWATIVYDPIAYWTWNSNGWLYNLPSHDFAGGGPVHVASGTTALAYSIMLGKRTGYVNNKGLPYRAHNVTNVVLGTVFLWIGWFGFNGGSALGMNILAIVASYNTQLAAITAGLTWAILDYRLERKWSAIGFCSGVVSGLVAITPAAGFVPFWAAVVIGILGGICCNFATKIKTLIGVDEPLDIFAVHGVGGMVGNILTGIFGATRIRSLDGSDPGPIGWLDGNFVQLGYQIAGTLACFAWAFVMSCIILFLINLVPGLSLRAPAAEEEIGMDDYQLGEFAYDYVELTRTLEPNSEGHLTAVGTARSSSSHEKTPAETV